MSKNINVPVPDIWHKELKKLARANSNKLLTVTVNDLVRNALKKIYKLEGKTKLRGRPGGKYGKYNGKWRNNISGKK